ncbi:hypothetical protein CHS0354_001001 [Potamilus streckersoni]|uniref:Polycystin cation channel PKD1/PKD2 domain-containing protein n=1 Tax=Potamilus streckersoni TaxID=2493646 RepID=A0AAE0TE42_9BIVA|nr:hypothetical protein CHS0354_001001 [Potamilus streckersoni]
MDGNETAKEEMITRTMAETKIEIGTVRIVTGQQRNEKDEKGRKLRSRLSLYIYSAAKWRDGNCYFNLIYFLMAIVQITKTALITKQMLDFGNHRAQFQDMDDRGRTTLRHLLLSNWETGMEVPPYPPSGGKYAVYTFNDLKKHINFAVEKYYSSPNDAVGIYILEESNDTDVHAVTFCANYFTYHSVKWGYGNHKAEIYDVCFKSEPKFDGANYSYDIVADLNKNNMNESIVLNSFLKINMTFHLFSLRLDSLTGSGRCLSIKGVISFTDKDNNGQALVDLKTDTGQISCKDIDVDLQDVETITEFQIAASVIVFSLISLVGSLVDLFAVGCCLYYQTEKYIKQNSAKLFHGKRNGFPLKEYARHIKGSNFVFVIGDICTLIGTIRVAFMMDVKWKLHRFDEYAIWLGLGCLLCWICLASYVHFSDKFNLLFKTMYHAIPHVLAYLICVCLLFVGFTLCGYVVFGPYHIKFQTMSKTADTLFAMITGDEIYLTLTVLETDKLGSQAVWWFAQTYLWLFVSIFTVLILNILIAIFNSAYEVIQKEYKKRRAKKNSDPLRRVLHELLHSNDNLQGSIRQVQNGLLEILNRQDNSDMSQREYMLQQELKAVAIDNYTLRKSKIKAFVESGGERLNKHLSCWKVHCIIPQEDTEV